MITKTDDFTCYGSFITAVVIDNANLREKMNDVDNQMFPANEKIVIFKPDQEPEWFSQYEDWNYAYYNDFNNVFEYARELANNQWFFIVDRPLSSFVLMRIAEQMNSIEKVNNQSMFEWEGIKVYKK